MYCSKCGSYISEGTTVCPNCNENVGAPSFNEAAQPAQSGVYYTPQQSEPQPEVQQNYFNQSQSYDYGAYTHPQPDYVMNKIKDNLSTANTLGIIAIIVGILVTPIAGIICGIIGLNKANQVPFIPNNPAINKEKEKVKKLNTIGIVIPIILWVIAIIVIVAATVLFGVGMATVTDWY